MRLIFETHATSLDNEAALASGWFDVDLSPAGEVQARELGRRWSASPPDRIFCSDLRRAVRTAEIAFPDRALEIARDPRLRECDYGAWTRRPAPEVQSAALVHITEPFPGGESYADCVNRVRAWIDERRAAAADTTLVIGHRATFYALEHVLSGTPLVEVIQRPWRWQPGWEYRLD